MSDEILREILNELKELNRKVSTIIDDASMYKKIKQAIKDVDVIVAEKKQDLKVEDAKGFTKGEKHIVEIHYDNGQTATEEYGDAKDMLFRLEYLWSKLDNNQIRKILDDE